MWGPTLIRVSLKLVSKYHLDTRTTIYSNWASEHMIMCPLNLSVNFI